MAKRQYWVVLYRFTSKDGLYSHVTTLGIFRDICAAERACAELKECASMVNYTDIKISPEQFRDDQYPE